MQAQARPRPSEKSRKIYGVYIHSILTMKVTLPITEVGKNMKGNLEKIISKRNEGKCIAEGFIRPGSIKVIRYSSGLVNHQYVDFDTVFECMICHPVEGMLIECDVKTITKAGIHAEVVDNTGAVPITVFVARDHHYSDRNFANIKENMKILIRVIGVRFELNDSCICVIGKLLDRASTEVKQKRPLRIIQGGDEAVEDEEDFQKHEAQDGDEESDDD
jgi:DNA-directed RNA polymerase subunit E'/Rpb7